VTVKSRPSLIPFDVCTVAEVPLENCILAAQDWWARNREVLPCAIPHDCFIGVGQVLAHGAAKYPEMGGRSWEHMPQYRKASVQFDALMRHAYTPGIEDESGLMHEHHAATRYLMLTALIARGTLIDDRPPATLRSDEVMVPKGSYVVAGGDT
jgi:hypothetical protein